ncbi:IQ domain-containing protein E-like [Sycon ciliatum]|uniref:IQ domain-containing protein E-like n=1 Tax=Sycon ciliatum TaxID=27933 RepID=UPI0031F60535
MAMNGSRRHSLRSASGSSVHMPDMDYPVEMHPRPGPQPHHRTGSAQARRSSTQAYVKSLHDSPYLAKTGPLRATHNGQATRKRPPRPSDAPAQAGSVLAASTRHARSLSASDRRDQDRRRIASHKSREDLLDEVADLRKIGRSHEHERNLLAGRVRHLEEEMNRKDKRIASFLDSGYVERNEAVRTRGASSAKAENMTMLSVLKRKVHSLETSLRQRDSELGQLRMDVKTTSLEELQIKVDTYYEEVLRLRHALADRRAAEQDTTRIEQSAQQIKSLSASLQRVTERNEELQQEKKQLKKDVKAAEAAAASAMTTAAMPSSLLKRQTSASSMSGTQRKERLQSVSDRFADSSRQEMVQHVSVVEEKTEELTRTLQQAHQEHLATLSEVKALKQKKQDSEAASAKINELEEQCEKLRSIVKRLKDDRTHYHKLAEERKQFSKHQASKISELGKRHKQLSNSLQQSEECLALEARAREHARQLEQRKSKTVVFSDSRSAKQQVAATTIQHQWRSHKAKRRQLKAEEDTAHAVSEVQSALRAQLTRSTLLAAGGPRSTSSEEEDDDDEQDDDDGM